MKSNTELRISPRAEQDLAAILDYIRKMWGTGQEDAYATVFRNAFERILQFPEISRPSPHAENERELILKYHTIAYHYRDNTVTILRLVNPRRKRR